MKKAIFGIGIFAATAFGAEPACLLKTGEFNSYFKASGEAGYVCGAPSILGGLDALTSGGPRGRVYACGPFKVTEKWLDRDGRSAEFTVEKGGVSFVCDVRKSAVTEGDDLDEYYGNETVEVRLPGFSELAPKAIEFLKRRSFELRDVEVEMAKVSNIFYISSYYDYESRRSDAVFLAVTEAPKANGSIGVVGVLLDANGSPVKLSGLSSYHGDLCVPYYFFELGGLTVRYSAGKNDRWVLRDRILREVFELLKDKQVLSWQEGVDMSLEPNMDIYEPQQSFRLKRMKPLYEPEAIAAVAGHPRAKELRLFAGYERAGHASNDPFNAELNAKCARLKD